MSRLGAVQCTANRRSGERCRAWSLRGASVCRAHGGLLPVVRAKAAERVALYEALERGDRRPVWQVLLDTVHAADVVMRDVKVSLGEGSDVTPEQLDRFVTAVERAARLAKTAIDARAGELASGQYTLEGEVIVRVLDEALSFADLADADNARLRLGLRTALERQEARERGDRVEPLASVGRPVLDGTVVA